MLYYLFRFLGEYGIPGSHIWTYISFRALLTLILSLVISVWFGEYFIKWMKRHNVSEAQRDKSIDPYGVEKKGVPTMGGIIIIVSIIVPCLLFGRLRNIYMILMLITTVWLGVLGFADDYIKMKVSKDGLRPVYKLAGQTLLGLFVGLTLWLSPDAVIRENVSTQRLGNTEVVVHKSEKVKSTITTIPFVKDNNLDYAEIMSFCGKYKTAAGWFLFVVMTTLVQRVESERRHGRHGSRQFGDYRCGIGRIGLRVQSYSLCQLPEHHVHTRFGGIGYLHLCFCRRVGRFLVV